MRLLDRALRAHRILRKSPVYGIGRILQEVNCELDRWLAPRRARHLDRDRLLALAGTSSVDHLWDHLRGRPFPAVTAPLEAAALDRVEAGESARILAAAQLAC